ncbi:hypothetical protein PV04_07748 [Phialophora macrospora]|uniref:Nucleotide-diphospho-sugar transferase domain-containing protein n=1 Tax=Phialophora macrospora TaxID=1851006 RepID=A0A0D2CJT2_9EURO|nr:hypothetical protein PV04_07748 [Phialophora macrospora]
MRFSGAIILHQLMLWAYLFEDVPDYIFYINVDANLKQRIGDFPRPNPPNGYGPYNARLLKELSYATYGQYATLNSADNFMWYALTKWWSYKCATQFGQSNDLGTQTRILMDVFTPREHRAEQIPGRREAGQDIDGIESRGPRTDSGAEMTIQSLKLR